MADPCISAMMNAFMSFPESAFAPMYGDEVVVSRDGRSQTLNALIMADNTLDAPESGELMESEVETVSITFPRNHDNVVRTIRRGDVLRRPILGKKYRVAKVYEDFALGVVVTAKSF